MNEEVPIKNPPLCADEQAAVSKLTDEDLREIDAAILAHSSNRWLKVVRVVWDVEHELKQHHPQLSYIFYAQRLIHLAEVGTLESQGNLEFMRFSEVRIPHRT